MKVEVKTGEGEEEGKTYEMKKKSLEQLSNEISIGVESCSLLWP